MARILVIDQDYRGFKQIVETFSLRDGHEVSVGKKQLPAGEKDNELSLGSQNVHQCYNANTMRDGLELLADRAFDLLLMDAAILESNPKDMVAGIRNKSLADNKSIPIVLLSHQEEMTYVKKFISSGILDFIVKPIDMPVFLQKMDLILTQGKSVEKQLYTMKGTDKTIGITFKFEITEVSEFGVTVKSHLPFQVDEFVTFYSDIFKEDGGLEVIGRCYSCEQDQNKREYFHVAFVFVGVNPSILKDVRKFLRAEYAKQKEQVA
jgi:CheY-like chemotaxis protein